MGSSNAVGTECARHSAGLTLIDSTISTTGVFIGTYVPAGEIAIGSFALDPSS